MKANYIYGVFETTKKNDVPDLTIGLAMHKAKEPLPEGMEDKALREFMGRHYEKLVEAFKTGDKDQFVKVVEQCEAKDQEACAGGVCDVPEV